MSVSRISPKGCQLLVAIVSLVLLSTLLALPSSAVEQALEEESLAGDDNHISSASTDDDGVEESPVSITSDIRNGDEAEPYSHPSMVALIGNGWSDVEGQFCGGVAIHPLWVLTAAHCFGADGLNVVDGVPEVDVLFGAHNLKDEDGRRFRVCEVIIHPEYGGNTEDSGPSKNDVAVLKLCKRHNYPTAKVAGGSTNFFGRPVVAPGWGLIADDGTDSTKLKEAQATVLNKQKCTQLTGSILSAIDHDSQLCVRGDQGDDGRAGFCQGDSGGPVFTRGSLSTDVPVVIGVASFVYDWRDILPGNDSDPCHSMAVYSRTTHFLPWIEDATDIRNFIPQKGISCSVPGGAVRYATHILKEGEKFIGTDRGDVIVATGGGANNIASGGGDDVICAGGGNDVVNGGAGSDIIIGGAGADKLSGGAGPDIIFGGAGIDRLSGNAGQDALFGGSGFDKIFGNAGDDLLDGGENGAKCVGGPGKDSVKNCKPTPSPEPAPEPDPDPGPPDLGIGSGKPLVVVLDGPSGPNQCSASVWIVMEKEAGANGYTISWEQDPVTVVVNDDFSYEDPGGSLTRNISSSGIDTALGLGFANEGGSPFYVGAYIYGESQSGDDVTAASCEANPQAFVAAIEIVSATAN